MNTIEELEDKLAMAKCLEAIKEALALHQCSLQAVPTLTAEGRIGAAVSLKRLPKVEHEVTYDSDGCR